MIWSQFMTHTSTCYNGALIVPLLYLVTCSRWCKPAAEIPKSISLLYRKFCILFQKRYDFSKNRHAYTEIIIRLQFIVQFGGKMYEKKVGTCSHIIRSASVESVKSFHILNWLKVHSRAQTWYLSVRKSYRRGVVHSTIWTPYIPKCAYGAHKACFTAETFWPRQSSEYVFA